MQMRLCLKHKCAFVQHNCAYAASALCVGFSFSLFGRIRVETASVRFDGRFSGTTDEEVTVLIP